MTTGKRRGRECDNEVAKRMIDALCLTKVSDDSETLTGVKATEYWRDIMLCRSDMCLGCQFVLRLVLKFGDDGCNEIYGFLKNDLAMADAWMMVGCEFTYEHQWYTFINRVCDIVNRVEIAMRMKLSDELLKVGE